MEKHFSEGKKPHTHLLMSCISIKNMVGYLF